jgi:Right handed beta helix region
MFAQRLPRDEARRIAANFAAARHLARGAAHQKTQSGDYAAGRLGPNPAPCDRLVPTCNPHAQGNAQGHSMTRSIFIAAALALAGTLPAAPAQAAAARTFVSAAGSDSNNCTNVLTPCRHLATAYAATAANGEIYVLDPANYGSLTITGPVSIEGHGWASIAPAPSSPAITINAPGATDKINIVGVVLDGTGLANTTGIQFNSGGRLNIRDSVIRNFGTSGINFAPNSATLSQIYVSNTLISDNGVGGIEIEPTGSGTTNGVFSHVEIENNGSTGLFVVTTTQTINVTVSDSVSANNGGAGIFVQSNGGTQVNVMARASTFANNVVEGLGADGIGATVRVTRSTITGNATGWAILSSGTMLSYGDNNIDGNGAANTEPPNPLTYH